ncbi:MAG: hypothetical protein ACI9KE_006222 [Polyangiales bacterium]|jgi:hypothetical protein
MVFVGLFLSLVFGFLAGLHVYWARGGLWPGTDPRSLLEHVVGASPSAETPSPAACLVVAGLLSVAACLPLALLGWVPMPMQLAEWVGLAAYGCAGVLLLRGLYGYVDHRVRPATLETPFFRLNRVLYSPLCLLLGGLMLYLSSSA